MARTQLTSGTLLLWLIVTMLVVNSFIVFADSHTKGVYAEIIVTSTVTITMGLAIILALRQLRQNRPHAPMYLSLAAGLVLWFCADVIWASYEVVFHVAAPIPSLSDVLWLAGYPFFAHNLFATYKEFKSKFDKRVLLAGIVGNAAFLVYLIVLTAGLSDFSTQEGIAMFAVMIAYPIMNAVLVTPALSILVGLWRENPWSIPWTFKSLSLFCIVVTDSWFAFVIIAGLYEQVWVASLLFGTEYIILAGGLLWFNKFLPVYKGHAHYKVSAAPFPRRNPSPVRYLQATVAVVLVGGIISYGFVSSVATGSAQYITPADAQLRDTITIGALLPLTGALSSFGEEAEAALKIAVEDVNEQLAASGSDTRIAMVMEDTRTDPGVALEKLKELTSRGIKIVIGPVTSAEVAAVRQYANHNDVLVVSIGSTAPDLAVPNDNIIRLVPDDTQQARVLARQMWDDGVRVIVPMWRADVFGNNLHQLLAENFRRLGGTVVDGVAYEPLVGDFSASLHRINFIFWEQHLRSLSEKVGEASSQYGAERVGVYMVAFDEIVPILIQADRHPELGSVRWYGSDGSAKVEGVVKNTEAAEFAIRTNFLNPIYGVEETEDFRALEERITREIGREPRSYAEATYDALWVAALALEGHESGPLRDRYMQVANSYVGVTGSTELNDAGDRRFGSYDFWAVREGHDDHHPFEWASVATSAIR